MIRLLLAMGMVIFSAIGLLLLFKSFFSFKILKKLTESSKKRMVAEYIGIIFLFFSGIIAIYFYSLQPVSQRIIRTIPVKKNDERKLPDISMDFQESRENNEK